MKLSRKDKTVAVLLSTPATQGKSGSIMHIKTGRNKRGSTPALQSMTTLERYFAAAKRGRELIEQDEGREQASKHLS